MTTSAAHTTSTAVVVRAGWEHIHTVAPLLAATMHDYLEQISVSLRPTSIEAANSDLARAATFFIAHDPTLRRARDLRRGHIEAFKIALATNPTRLGTLPKPATMRRCLSALRMFFLRIIEWDWPDAPARNPMFIGDLPREDEPLPRFLDDAAFTRVMHAISLDTNPLRRLVMELLARTGMRVSEICGLDHDAMVHLGDTHWLRVPLGKLRNDRYVPLHPHLVELITTWRHNHPAGPTRRLLTSRDQPISRHTITRMCHLIGRRADVTNLHPHRFRHTLATQAINSGMSLDAIAALLGHRSLDMTRRYARIANKTVAAEYQRVTASIEANYTNPTEGPTMRLLRAEHHRLLGNGYCQRPAQLDCRYESICETCTHFHTSLEFHPILIRQRDHANRNNQPDRAHLFDELLHRTP